jgi:hypothetical protein
LAGFAQFRKLILNPSQARIIPVKTVSRCAHATGWLDGDNIVALACKPRGVAAGAGIDVQHRTGRLIQKRLQPAIEFRWIDKLIAADKITSMAVVPASGLRHLPPQTCLEALTVLPKPRNRKQRVAERLMSRAKLRTA